MDTFEGKSALLRRRLRETESAVVAFSGGVDSSVLAAAAHEELAHRMIAVTAVSPSLPESDRVFAAQFCAKLGIPHRFVETDEFEDPDFRMNPENRCYYCKHSLYEKLVSVADEIAFKYVLEGTNASDLGGHRPGWRASRENPRVLTLLIETGFTKEDVRQLAREMNLPTADKPSAACLASRVPAGELLTGELMRRIDRAEDILREMGVGQVRVRHNGIIARIEVLPCDFGICIERRGEILEKFAKLGWKKTVMDLKGYQTGGA